MSRARDRSPSPQSEGRAWNSMDATEVLDSLAPYPAGRVQRAAKGSTRIRRTTFLFQALLVVAMLVALATTVIGLHDAGASTGANSPDDPAPAVFIFPSD